MIAVCITTFNDLDALRVTLPYTKRWCDELVIVDAGSVDGTIEYLQLFLGERDKLIQLPEREILKIGLDKPHNMAADVASGEWIVALPADCFLHPSDIDLLKSEMTTGDSVLRVDSLNLPQSSFAVAQAEAAIHNTILTTEPKDWIYRRGSGHEFRGYVHEELYKGVERAIGRATAVRIYNLSGIRSHRTLHHVAARNAYRMKMVSLHPELRLGVNPYWYEEFFPKQQPYQNDLADLFAHLNNLKFEHVK